MVLSRPGGRSARTRTAVFEAASALLLTKDAAELTITEIATRAGVAPTSLYRRWGDVSGLIMDLAVDRLTLDWPLPNTGSLHGDLMQWSRRIAISLNSREGSQFFRVFIATAPPRQPSSERTAAIMRRVYQIAELLERAAARGEQPPTVMEVTDHVLAPLYLRALFGAPADEAFAETLVDRVLGTSSA